MDRKIYKLPIGKSGLTSFPCPTCGKKRLKIKNDTFHHKETKDSENAHSDEEWDPELIEYVYSCLLECSNSACKDVVSSSGVGSLEQEIAYNEDETYSEVYVYENFMPKYFEPHLKIFSQPKNTPTEVIKEIEKSFSLFFSDPPSAANHLRIALENLLTHLKIKRFVTKNGSRKHLPLHQRIKLLPTKFEHVKELFLAIKWLGNAGSHSDKIISVDDVLDAYELMDELLVEIFSSKRKNLKKLAKRINKKKGPK